ncbi:thioredoxin domain-containing protein [Vibrio sp. ZSDZ65]|uniref:Thioredoxin domain-containing protein n=1 Tax=Vibrio qingdaonensis TaxID=2829491 RepID=A0A9X3CM05_9VIBR|nr:thioredoxin domain-containing protein [Vibrio qingdaonensis]MCW8345706.1 thioredoxin domain-containing protein [Vibrio qingdaonensis]
MKSLFTLMVFTLVQFSAVASPYKAGQHYLTLTHAPSIEPQVMLFHSPFCGPCAMVHGPIMQIVKQHNATFREIIVGVGPVGRDVQEAFIVAKEQGLEQSFIEELIHRIHFRANHAPQYREDFVEVLDTCGVQQDKFESRCQSVNDQVEDFNRLVKAYRINATPTIVVNGNKQVVLHRLNSFEELDALIAELLAS